MSEKTIGISMSMLRAYKTRTAKLEIAWIEA